MCSKKQEYSRQFWREKEHNAEMYEKYDNVIYLLKELAMYCDSERDIKKIKKAIARVKKKQEKYYVPTLLDFSDYNNFLSNNRSSNSNKSLLLDINDYNKKYRKNK